MERDGVEAIAAACRCGAVTLEMTGKPIVSADCYCTSCAEAGRRFETAPGGARVLGADGGTGFALFRKDRVRFTSGTGQLTEHRLTPKATTRRVAAGCCGTPMFLEFAGGHWLSIYRDRLPEGAAPVEMRVMTRDRREGVTLPADVPNYRTHSGRFMWRLLAAWAAMGFRSPKVTL